VTDIKSRTVVWQNHPLFKSLLSSDFSNLRQKTPCGRCSYRASISPSLDSTTSAITGFLSFLSILVIHVPPALNPLSQAGSHLKTNPTMLQICLNNLCGFSWLNLSRFSLYTWKNYPGLQGDPIIGATVSFMRVLLMFS
jgi:hypothetical protein